MGAHFFCEITAGAGIFGGVKVFCYTGCNVLLHRYIDLSSLDVSVQVVQLFLSEDLKTCLLLHC